MLRAIDDTCSTLRARVDLGPHRVRLGRAGLGQHRELDEVAREPLLAGRGELAGPGQHVVEPAGERRPTPGLLGTRRGQQVVGLAVPPAAVAAPHVAHDELRVVVHRLQVRLVAQVRGHLDLVDDPVEVTPWFISASVCVSSESSSSAVSVSARCTRSAPKIGRPWPASMTSAPQAAISRSATAQSLT